VPLASPPRFNAQSSLSVSIRTTAARKNLSNFRYRNDDCKKRLSPRPCGHAGWELNLGNSISSQGDALVGPYVFGRGARPGGRTGQTHNRASFIANRHLPSPPNGHLLRGQRRTRNVEKRQIAFVFFGTLWRRRCYTTLSHRAALLVLDSGHSGRNSKLNGGSPRLPTASNVVAGPWPGRARVFDPPRGHIVSCTAGRLSLANAAGGCCHRIRPRELLPRTANARRSSPRDGVQMAQPSRDFYPSRRSCVSMGAMRVFGSTALDGATHTRSFTPVSSHETSSGEERAPHSLGCVALCSEVGHGGTRGQLPESSS
jgi:hypothetical protein